MAGIVLSIDLEDVRDWVVDGHRYREAVPRTTRRYLQIFREWKVNATFFVVGHVARRYPELIAEIRDGGHEIACHGATHTQLDKLTPKSFARDLEENIRSLREAGAGEIKGFRAPTFSLMKTTAWAHEVLSDMGFIYSSSVLPAPSPLYGWPEFGRKPKHVTSSLWEIPITLHRIPGLSVPVAGGVYFRVLPFFITRWSVMRHLEDGVSVGTYFHPYDIDCEQERFMHPDLNNRAALNMLMYIGRSRVIPRLARLRKTCSFFSYREYVAELQTEQ